MCNPTESARSQPAPAAADEFFILSVKWTGGDVLVWWGPDDTGYTTLIDYAGRYTREQVERRRSYYDNGDTTLAIPCSAVETRIIRIVYAHHLEALMAERFSAAVGELDPPRTTGEQAIVHLHDDNERPHVSGSAPP